MSSRSSVATKTVSAFVVLAVVASTMTLGSVAQNTQQQSDTSALDAEPNDSMTNATHVEYSEEIDANLSSKDDVDYYAVNATAGDAIVAELHLENMFEGSAIAVDIVTPSGDVSTEMTNDQMGGPKPVAGDARPLEAKETAYTADTMESDGTYYVRVQEDQSNETDGNVTYEYNLTVETKDLDKYDPNENGSTATGLDVGSTVDGTFAPYDNDVYAVNLTAGQNYTMRYTSPDDATDWEPEVSLLGNASNVTDWDDRSEGDAVFREEVLENQTVTFTVEENGTYYFELTEHDINNVLLAQTNYSLTVLESEPGEEHPDLPDDGDADDDGLTNEREQELGTDPKDADTGGDGLTDGQEVELGSDPTWDNTFEDRTKDAVNDTDGDGLPDWLEEELDTDPTDPDTDDDGVEDDYEIRIGSDPTDPDTDDDGVSDGETFCG